jgi:hypothetical protein
METAMRDPHDSGTGELLKRPRGRPATGRAKSDAERAKTYRQQQKVRVSENHKPAHATTATLLQELRVLCADGLRVSVRADRGQRVHAILRELGNRFPEN